MADGLKRCENNELMLELSIGGIFDNIEKPKQSTSESVETQSVQPERQIQGTRRLELRRKREEMLKKSDDFGSCGSVSGPFVENKEWLEKQIAKQTDDVLVIEPARKKEIRVGRLLHGNVGFRPPYDMNLKLAADENEVDGGGGQRLCKVNSNGSGGCDSSVYSVGQCSSHQDDCRSNSSNSQLDQQLASTSAASANPSDPYDQPTGSSKLTVSITKLTNSALSKPSPANPHESSVSNPSCKLDQTRIQHQHASVLERMPCVSTTGNGPNGKTISGFLYRYTKNEVTIVCVCHGQLFNPAGFVEHAGGVNIAHPLKHITIFPTAFAS